MNNDFDEVTEDLIWWLYRRNYKDKNKEWTRLKIMYFIFKVCSSEENFDRIVRLVEKDREEQESKKLVK